MKEQRKPRLTIVDSAGKLNPGSLEQLMREVIEKFTNDPEERAALPDILNDKTDLGVMWGVKMVFWDPRNHDRRQAFLFPHMWVHEADAKTVRDLFSEDPKAGDYITTWVDKDYIHIDPGVWTVWYSEVVKLAVAPF